MYPKVLLPALSGLELAAIAIALAAVVYAGVRIWRAWFGSATPPPATAAGQAAVSAINTKLAELRAADRSPSAEECAELRRQLQIAINGRVSAVTTTAQKNAIDLLCPGN